MSLAAVILAAGKGTRMKSHRPKVLHEIAGRSMVNYVLDAVGEAGADTAVVIAGYGFLDVEQAVGTRATVVLQEEQLGTGHAVLQAETVLGGHSGEVLVVCGDTPLVTGQSLAGLVALHRSRGAAATILTAVMDDPTGYGRIIRTPEGEVSRIVEQKDGTPEELAVREINTGIYCFAADGFFAALHRIGNDNRQGEYYLTDIIGIYVGEGRLVASYQAADPVETLGVNDRLQLAAVERIVRRRILENLMLSGVTIVDPDSTYIDATAEIGPDSTIFPQTFVRGQSVVGRGCRIGPATELTDAVVGDEVNVWRSVVVQSRVGDRSTIGPFAYLRPGTALAAGVKVGDFVEIKKSFVGEGSKVPHLSYVGDAVIGKGVNVGAGTITCNYDGTKKWTTEMEDGAFIGSNTNLVAPVKVGRGAYVAAGSTITKDVPPGALGVARDRQKNVEDWVSRKSGKKQDSTEG